MAETNASRERFEKWWDSDDGTHALATGKAKDFAHLTWQAAERDTRERCVQIAIEVRDKFMKVDFRENAYGANEVAERILGKE